MGSVFPIFFLSWSPTSSLLYQRNLLESASDLVRSYSPTNPRGAETSTYLGSEGFGTRKAPYRHLVG
ncbi:hypothetical protein AB1N83_011065 [Pleurotus pulmonarius]